MAVKKPVTTVAEGAEATENEKVDITTNETEKTENRAVETAETEPETVKLIYIGPTLPKAALKTNSIFDGTDKEIKEHLRPVIKKYPLVEKLLVPTRELAEKKDKVRTAGNILNKYYSDLVSVIAASLEKEE